MDNEGKHANRDTSTINDLNETLLCVIRVTEQAIVCTLLTVSIFCITILYYHPSLKTHTKWGAMDELDQKLLNELERQGFQSATTLAHRFDVGERTIRRRIGNMSSKDIIRVVALPNFPLLGYRAWSNV